MRKKCLTTHDSLPPASRESANKFKEAPHLITLGFCDLAARPLSLVDFGFPQPKSLNKTKLKIPVVLHTHTYIPIYKYRYRYIDIHTYTLLYHIYMYIDSRMYIMDGVKGQIWTSVTKQWFWGASGTACSIAWQPNQLPKARWDGQPQKKATAVVEISWLKLQKFLEAWCDHLTFIEWCNKKWWRCSPLQAGVTFSMLWVHSATHQRTSKKIMKNSYTVKFHDPNQYVLLKVALTFPFQAIYTQAPHVLFPKPKKHPSLIGKGVVPSSLCGLMWLLMCFSFHLEILFLSWLVVCRNSPGDSSLGFTVYIYIDRMPLVAFGHQAFFTYWVYWIFVADWLSLANLRDMENMISGEEKRRCFQEWKLKQGTFEGHSTPTKKSVFFPTYISFFQYQTMHYYKGNPSNLP